MIGGLIIGFVGSLHCLGMCGPLLMSMPAYGSHGRWRIMLYHLGRFSGYAIIGLMFGLLGATLRLVMVQQWVTVAAGVLMLVWVLTHFVKPVKRFFSGMKLYGALRKKFTPLIARKDNVGQATLGLLNGFLPCGLVYLAATGAVALGSPLEAMAFMVLFGLGTLPALAALTATKALAGKKWRFSFNRIVPALATIAAVLLIVRGLGLGVPYLSPKMQQDTHGNNTTNCCTKAEAAEHLK